MTPPNEVTEKMSPVDWFATLKPPLCCRECEQKALIHARDLYGKLYNERDALRSQLKEAREIFFNYGCHKSDCAWFVLTLNRFKCSCGFDEKMEKLRPLGLGAG